MRGRRRRKLLGISITLRYLHSSRYVEKKNLLDHVGVLHSNHFHTVPSRQLENESHNLNPDQYIKKQGHTKRDFPSGVAVRGRLCKITHISG